ncbi:hypothetical protein A2630_04075 [Candidatus Woesebacteria bacterium RIFCSPHIGHO2_01_FULL_44_10]|nr:MAG: hypothetical protein A2630_04075 [Candidatus Woesebacteria bacterium RIFCSPHIGHO2_01_FULL_44_10]
MNKIKSIKYSVGLFSFLLVAWGFYRFLFQLPEEIEELIVKPVIWLVPTLFIVFIREKSNLASLGVTAKNIFPALYFALALGVVFAIEGIVLNFVKYGGFNFAANIGDKAIFASLGISFVTGISEELAFRGYIFNRIWQATGREWTSNLVTSFGWAAIHLPVNIFVLGLSPAAIGLNLFLTFIFGVGSALVFARTKNVFSSVFLHVLWEWPIILFR